MLRWRLCREIFKNSARSFEIETVSVGAKPAPKLRNGDSTPRFGLVGLFEGESECVLCTQTDPHEPRNWEHAILESTTLTVNIEFRKAIIRAGTLASIEIMDFRSGTK